MAELPLICSTWKINWFFPLGMSVAQYMGLPQPSSSVALSGACRGTQKKLFPCLVYQSWGVWWRQPVPSAICHATCEHHTLLPICMPGWISRCQQDGYTLPYMGTCGASNSICTTGEGLEGRDRQSTPSRPWEAMSINFWLLKQDRSPWEQGQHLPLGQSQTRWADFVLNRSLPTARRKTAQRFSAASLFWFLISHSL